MNKNHAIIVKKIIHQYSLDLYLREGIRSYYIYSLFYKNTKSTGINQSELLSIDFFQTIIRGHKVAHVDKDSRPSDTILM